jgi:CheY-like chemotaxis protein
MKLPEALRTTSAGLPTAGLRTNAFRILIADDLPQNRTILSRIFAKVGYEVEVVTNGTEAIARLVQDEPRPDLIVTDIEMPGMNGIELVRAVRALPEPVCRTPVLAASGSHDTILQRDMSLAGADGFISKPIDVPELLDIAGRLIRESMGRRIAPLPIRDFRSNRV